jgi:hypothetical protein
VYRLALDFLAFAHHVVIIVSTPACSAFRRKNASIFDHYRCES